MLSRLPTGASLVPMFAFERRGASMDRGAGKGAEVAGEEEI